MNLRILSHRQHSHSSTSGELDRRWMSLGGLVQWLTCPEIVLREFRAKLDWRLERGNLCICQGNHLTKMMMEMIPKTSKERSATYGRNVIIEHLFAERLSKPASN